MTSKEALGLLASRVQVGAYKEEMQKCFDIVNEALLQAQKQEKLLARLEEENKRLKAQIYTYDLENIQLKQDISLIINYQEQSTVLFNYIAEVYEELDSLMARLQDDYNNGIEFEQREEDRLIIGNILDIFTDLEDILPLKKPLEKLLGEEK